MGGFNGNGVYVRYYNWTQDASAGIDIRADRMDTEDTGYATGLSNVICKDGQTTVTANLPMATFRHTGVGNAVSRTDYAVTGQVQDNIYTTLSSVSGTNTITAALSVPLLSAYAQGQEFALKATGTNTGATTLNINAIGAITIKKLGVDLAAGDITSGDTVFVIYDGTNFQMISPARTPVITSGSIPVSAISGLSAALQAVYPVGSVYLSTTSTNPGTSLGFGTWSAFAQGLVLVGAGTGTDSNSVSQTFTAGTQVGEYKHTLTAAETPALSGSVSGGTSNTASNTGVIFSAGPYSSNTTASYGATINSGGGGSHNNVQPSIPVYIWQRTA